MSDWYVPMTFGVLDAVPITESAVVSITDENGTLPEDSTPAWSATAAAGSYPPGTLVHRATTHQVYSRITAHTAVEATTPEAAGPAVWKPLRTTNRAAAFDIYTSTKLVGEGEVTIVLQPGGFVDAVWLGGLEATEVFVKVQDGVGGPLVLEETSYYLAGEGRYDWQTFFLAPVRVKDSAYIGGIQLCADPVITIRLTQVGGSPAIGMVQAGRFIGLGSTQYDADVGRIRYSTINTAADGTRSFTPRPSGGEVNVRVITPRDKAGEIDGLLALYDARPALWIGSTDNRLGVLTKFGLFEGRVRFVNYQFNELAGTITGFI